MNCWMTIVNIKIANKMTQFQTPIYQAARDIYIYIHIQ